MKTIAHNLLLFAALALPALCAAQPKPTDDPQRNLQKFDNFYRYLNMTYVDTVHNGQLVENAIREVLLQLDPHSAYVSPEEMVEVNESFDGSFSGIGIEFNVLNDTIIVVNVISGGPSEKVGLLPNDRIVEVNGQNVVGTKRIDVPKILRGPKGTKAETRVVRRGVEEPLDFTIVRDNIPINTVDAAYKVDPSTGYIRVNRFANNTFKEFAEAIDKMGPIDALILDLRGNGGGLMDQAIRMSNYFLPQGSVIVSTEGMKVPSDRIVAPSDGPFKGKVIVLVNETSAADRSPDVRQRACPAPVPSERRLGSPADRSPLPHSYRTGYPAAFPLRRPRRLLRRFQPPVPNRRLGRQGGGRFDAGLQDPQAREDGLRRRRHHTGHRCRGRHERLYGILGQPDSQRNHQRVRRRVYG